ncbi:MAG TPA: hypothetical protein VMK66_13010 [Myxococcales bacterium]|nr:hypothetical protein [Myxococcales bacterium]
MFTVRLVARPDPRMVEVPLEIEAELPREFDGAALLASSGLPRRVRLKAAKDSLKLSTAYRADQLVADIVKSALRGSAQDVEKAQEAAARFIRAVRERRQDGATLAISSSGKGPIEVLEQMPPAPRPAGPPIVAPQTQRIVLPADRTTALERKLAEMEAVLTERILALEQKLASATAQLSRLQYASQVAGPGMEKGARPAARTGASTRRATAVEAYAEGLRAELTARTGAASARARTDVERCDRAAALTADAEMLGVPPDGTSQRLREASAQAAARQTALERLAEEIEFYAGADLPVAAQLLARLEDSPVPDPAPSLEPIAQALVRAAGGPDAEARAGWVQRAAALAAWEVVLPKPGDPFDPDAHQAVDSGGASVVGVACPGVKRTDGSVIVQARVLAARPPGAEGAAAQSAAAPAPAAEVPAPAPENAAPPPPAPEGPTVPPPAPAAAAPDSAPLVAPWETPILPAEAAAAAAAASLVPRVVVSEDPAAKDEALAVEVALSALRPVSNLPVQASDAGLEEAHPLVDPLPDDDSPNE